MPIIRRKRTHVSSTRLNEVEAEGLSYLCFAEDHSWFQGNIQSDDDSNYSLLGQRIKSDSDQEIEIESTNNNNNNEENLPPFEIEKKQKQEQGHQVSHQQKDFYNVTLIDHFSGQNYTLPKICLNRNQIENQQQDFGGEEGSIIQFTTGVNGTSTTESEGQEFRFNVENVYKNQKAEMIIQQHLGSSILLSQKCVVYSGPMRISFIEVIEPEGKTWCL